MRHKEKQMKTIVFDKSTGSLKRGVTILENDKAIVFRGDCGTNQIITKKENIKILKIS
jgi:ATP-dependent RNA circularization protein (DNA/RNA ligase family)